MQKKRALAETLLPNQIKCAARAKGVRHDLHAYRL